MVPACRARSAQAWCQPSTEPARQLPPCAHTSHGAVSLPGSKVRTYTWCPAAGRSCDSQRTRAAGLRTSGSDMGVPLGEVRAGVSAAARPVPGARPRRAAGRGGTGDEGTRGPESSGPTGHVLSLPHRGPARGAPA
ncbi:hypothetical protein GCM10010441_27680 [Kitasatospora paracochleata]